MEQWTTPTSGGIRSGTVETLKVASGGPAPRCHQLWRREIGGIGGWYEHLDEGACEDGAFALELGERGGEGFGVEATRVGARQIGGEESF